MTGARSGPEPTPDAETVTEIVVTETVVPASAGPAGVSGPEIVPAEHVTAPVVESLTGSPAEADRVAAVVLAVPGVAGLHGGAFGEVATYLPGRRVTGIRIDPLPTPAEVADPTAGARGSARIEVHIVARYPARVAVVAQEVRAALAALAGHRVVDVFVEDYAEDAGVLGQRFADTDPRSAPGSAPSG